MDSQVSAKVVENWIKKSRIVLLLDALDQVAPQHRGECVTAINQFHCDHLEIPLIVSCRSGDYQELSSTLKIDSVVVIHPLTRAVVEATLRTDEQGLAGLRAALNQVPELYETLQTPLMLDVARIAYANLKEPHFKQGITVDELRRQLFYGYVDRMLGLSGAPHRSHARRVVGTLVWIAGNLRIYGHTFFYS